MLDRKLTWENKVLDHMKTENNLNGQSEHPLITIQEKKNNYGRSFFAMSAKIEEKNFHILLGELEQICFTNLH